MCKRLLQGPRGFSKENGRLGDCSTDIELRAFSRGFLSGELGHVVFAGTPMRRHADTIAFCGCGFAALCSRRRSLSTVSLNSSPEGSCWLTTKIFHFTSKVLISTSVIIAVTTRPSTTKPRIYYVAMRFFYYGCSSQELTESHEDFPEIHASFLLTPLITDHADNLV